MQVSDLTYFAPTVCALLGIEPPALANEAPNTAVMYAAGGPIDRLLVYAPDAIGRHLLTENPWHRELLQETAPLELPVSSILPTVTPVCFASLFSGARPAEHGIQKYEKPVLTCDTLFDSLVRAGKRTAIVAVRHSSVDLIFRGRAVDYYTEDYDPQVTARALWLLQRGQHEVIVVYHQAYDDMLHQTEPFSDECIEAFKSHIQSFGLFSAAAAVNWYEHRHALVFAPDHGAHVDPVSGRGTHGADMPSDMELLHYWRFMEPG